MPGSSKAATVIDTILIKRPISSTFQLPNVRIRYFFIFYLYIFIRQRLRQHRRLSA
jgi:hypothetical protein